MLACILIAMARNMIEANAALFARLGGVARAAISDEIAKQKRCVATNAEEKKWLKNVIFTPNYLFHSRDGMLLRAEMDGDVYLISIGHSVGAIAGELEEVALNAGLFTALAADFELTLSTNGTQPAWLAEYIFYPVEDVDGVGGIERLDLPTVAAAFEKVMVFLVNPKSALLEDGPDLSRTAIALCAKTRQGMVLGWSDEALALAASAAFDSTLKLPFHLILRALKEFSADNAFLAIYRCVELLFPLPKISELSGLLSLATPGLELASIIEKCLGWRRREEDALTDVFAGFEADELGAIVEKLEIPLSERTASERIARHVYELRNTCVHYRPAQSMAARKDDAFWLSRAEMMLALLEKLYRRHDAAF